jgi:Zn-dependent membrane protease YugP
MVPAVSALSRLGSMLLPIGMILLIFTRSQSPFAITLLWGAAVGLAAVVVFSLVTLPVEIDASRRALKLLGNTGILVEGEMQGARAVLNAAAWTYVAAAAAAIIELLLVLAILSAAGRGRSSS